MDAFFDYKVKCQDDLTTQDCLDAEKVFKIAEGMLNPAEKVCQDAFQVLSCNETFKDCRRKFYDLSKKHHPDKGGDEKVYAPISAAWDKAQDCLKPQQKS